jgi:nicotinamide riboside transporter PnuC
MTVIYLGAILLGVFMYSEQYWLWLLIDVVSIVYIALQIGGVGIGYSALYLVPTFVLVIGYGFTSVWGHFKWK